MGDSRGGKALADVMLRHGVPREGPARTGLAGPLTPACVRAQLFAHVRKFAFCMAVQQTSAVSQAQMRPQQT